MKNLFTFVLIIFFIFIWHETYHQIAYPILKVSFLDIGQGDSTLIQTPSGTVALIDGGPNNLSLQHLGKELGFLKRDIDYLVQTHVDSDHIISFPVIMKRYDVGSLIQHSSHATNSITDYYSNTIEKINITQNQKIILDPQFGTYLWFHYPPESQTSKNKNDTSLVMSLHHGNTCVMFTGDASKKIEQKISRSIPFQKCDVIQVGHHGSKTSTHPSFLQRFTFQNAIISAGKDNRHGHPHGDVIQTLKNSSTTIHSTAHDGTLTLISNGGEYTITSSEITELHYSSGQ